MLLKVSRSKTSGRVKIPGSKSHTIRALFIASLAEGRSEIINPLISDDAVSAVKTCKAMGADVKIEKDRYIVDGFNGIPKVPDNVIDVGNSGTTLRFATAASALGDGYSVFTGDEQIRRRPIGPLLEALNNLGAQAFSTRGDGRAPLVVKGRMTGGRTPLDSVTSQYLSALLISTPLLEKDTEIDIIRLNEVPYVDITLWWLDKQNIRYENSSYKTFYIPGGQKYKPFKEVIPGDFSSATFFMVLAAISGGEFILENLDISDPQGDRQVLDILKSMGAEVRIDGKNITISGRELIGREIDMNSIPDALPAMAVAGCFAEGETRLINVPQARLKETDRIRVMYEELSKLGADVEELPDGLIIRQSKLKGCPLNGHGDHRIVMALAVAGLNIDGDTVIDTAESISVTFPEFVDLVKACGGNAELVEQS
ncbi:3-phosphoshikimate 1-carboxyvinyltransferase [Clostridium thermosuccinogenes]|uniref:3-phosphoshikimate 1-carboxyvinyltransferase n=1 Tax=Clostridium thermosuccinogenes TaxID=84032 RepID=A0A2K2FLM0_9CLOT|nr:3-phosphoshikimate 1-carboxyvinyltransferase [Pseudoclostridium thermosuccinogenes]AUS96904.1 3-phosphoshikimate 1-carboxyvinyltransferase [Pseudoclostridium thermosuccinogenes]PNT99679.1 3-phosphoshikimate 1-carboxyvinyltransferase [Pseudoclostridium thermosuccinogenes]PNU01187.1 3-phosphoshikimate 1-carboxyvinyltransferase [Pseudoclostridium thermosuccinogenes]